MRHISTILLVFILLLQLGCGTEAENYKDAYLVITADTTYLKLKGKRVLMHFEGTYEDSIMIPIAKSEGRIEGKDIPVKKGYYKYQGFILINKTKVIVKLLLDNYDDKLLDPLPWNGEYNLKK